MSCEHFLLVKDFPDAHRELSALCESQPYVSRATRRYLQLREQILQIETGIAPEGEDTVSDLKLQCLLLRDELNRHVRAARYRQCLLDTGRSPPNEPGT